VVPLLRSWHFASVEWWIIVECLLVLLAVIAILTAVVGSAPNGACESGKPRSIARLRSAAISQSAYARVVAHNSTRRAPAKGRQRGDCKRVDGLLEMQCHQ